MGTNRTHGRRRRLLKVGVWIMAVVTGAIAVTMAWAFASLDSSTLARALVWRDADVYDIDRFARREIAAPDRASPLLPCAEQLALAGARTTTGGDATGLRDLLEQTSTRGFLVVRDGCVLAEYYGQGADERTLLTSFSVAKSVLATLVGIAVQRGELSGLDTPVTSYLPELAEKDPEFHQVTLRSLMAMASGIHYEEGAVMGDDTETYYSPDLRRTALAAEMQEAPMTRWHYNNYNPLLMGMVLERATGMSVSAYAERHLWGPLGAEQDASWSLDSRASGFEKLESGFNASLRDWGRFGVLASRAGHVGGEEFATTGFWDDATSPQRHADGGALDRGYGLWWWLDEAHPGAFMARGNLGQFVYVDPRTAVVVVRFGEEVGIDAWPTVLADVARQAAARP